MSGPVIHRPVGPGVETTQVGPLAVLNVNPRRRYYGFITTSGFYAVVVAELWYWTGDKALIRPLRDPALKALRWLDDYGDLDGDGSYEYQTRSMLCSDRDGVIVNGTGLCWPWRGPMARR
jgi:glycogen debranching enzyme